MASLYADEDFPYPVVERLRALGHDVLTTYEAGRANHPTLARQHLRVNRPNKPANQ